MCIWNFTFSSVQFSCSVVSDSLQPHESQHARPLCPSPTPAVHSDSRPSSQWCHPAISSSVVPFSSCPQSLPASGSFPMSQLFAWGGQSTGVSTYKHTHTSNTCKCIKSGSCPYNLLWKLYTLKEKHCSNILPFKKKKEDAKIKTYVTERSKHITSKLF